MVIKVLSDSFYGIACIGVLGGLVITFVFYLVFYRKYTGQLTEAFIFLERQRFIDRNADIFFEQLGAAGFGYRVIIMAKIISGKPVRIDKGRWLEPRATQLLLKNYDFSWIKKFYWLYHTVIILMVAMAALVFIKQP